jgi:hypothetical protein
MGWGGGFSCNPRFVAIVILFVFYFCCFSKPMYSCRPIEWSIIEGRSPENVLAKPYSIIANLSRDHVTSKLNFASVHLVKQIPFHSTLLRFSHPQHT